MAKNQQTSFSFAPYQGRAGQGPQFGRNLVAATDQIGEFAQEDEAKAKTIATNKVFARVAQGETIEDVLQTTDPALVDAASLMKWQDEHNASVSGLEVDQANIRSSDASADFNVARTAEVGPNGIAQRSLQKSQQEEAAAKAARQGTLAEREAEDYAEGKRVKSAVAEMNDYYFNGGMQAELDAQYDEYATNEGFNQEQADTYRGVWEKYQQDKIQNKPDWMLQMASRFGLTPAQFTANSELGRQYQVTIDQQAQREGDQAKIDADADEAYQKGVDDYLGNDYSSGQITASGVTFGPSTNKVSGEDAKAFAKQLGYNVQAGKKGNQNHRDAVASLKANFPDQESFQYGLEMLKTMDGKIADNLPTVITTLRKAMEAAAMEQVSQRTNSLYTGLSPNEIVNNMIEAADSRSQVNIRREAETGITQAETDLKTALLAEGVEVNIHPDKVGQADNAIAYIEKLRKEIDTQKKTNGVPLSTQQIAKKEQQLRSALTRLESPPLEPLGPDSFFPGNRIKP